MALVGCLCSVGVIHEMGDHRESGTFGLSILNYEVSEEERRN